jgi:hypothetical protein
VVNYPGDVKGPWAEVEVDDVSVEVAETCLQIARTAKAPLSCYPVSQFGCMGCDAIKQDMEERARVLSREPFSRDGSEGGKDRVADSGIEESAGQRSGGSVPFEPWCHYDLVSSRSDTLRLEREQALDSADCEAYRVERGPEVLVKVRACDDRNRADASLGRPRERRAYWWQLPQGVFDLNLLHVLRDEWWLVGRLKPWNTLQFPQIVDFESTRAIGGTTLRDVVTFLSTVGFRPSECEAGRTADCARCASIMKTREEVDRRGLFAVTRKQGSRSPIKRVNPL